MKPAADPVSDSTVNNVINDHETKPFTTKFDAFKKQKEIYGWSLWDERVFIENLYNQRFNYLLVVYGLLLNILYQVNGKLTTIFLGLFGAVLLSVLWLMMNRIYRKLDICLKYLHRVQSNEDYEGVVTPLELSDPDSELNSQDEPKKTILDKISVAFGKKKVLHYQVGLALVCILSWIILVIIKFLLLFP